MSGLLEKYSSKSKVYKFCPGLDVSQYEQYKDIVRFDVKSLRKTEEPFLHIDSVRCLLWFLLGKTISVQRREAEAVICPPCVKLRGNLDHQARRTAAESPSKRVKRQDASSHARLSYMSPASQAKRKEHQKKERDEAKRKAKSYEHTELPLDTEQHEQMDAVTSAIEKECPGELEKLFVEGEKHGVGSKLRDVWNLDKQRERNEFKRDQLINSKCNFHMHVLL